MNLQDILEEYKKKIHGSEYDYHCKHCTLDEHNEYMRIAQHQAKSKIEEMYAKDTYGCAKRCAVVESLKAELKEIRNRVEGGK